jgi:glycerophosphoryl diester phosphodiesterase
MHVRYPTFHPPVIAHRGSRTGAPENTLAAFRLAYQEGARWIETDVKVTQDGIPILMHDDTLNRTTNGHGSVADRTWADIQTLDAGLWFGDSFQNEHVPSLVQALQFFLDYGLRPNLEIKPCRGRTRVTAMATLMEASKIWPVDLPPPLISSFDHEALAIAAHLRPDWPRGVLLDEWRDDWRETALTVEANAIHMEASQLTHERTSLILRSELPLLSYTVNVPSRARELLNWGVSAIFSDNPKEMLGALAAPT